MEKHFLPCRISHKIISSLFPSKWILLFFFFYLCVCFFICTPWGTVLSQWWRGREEASSRVCTRLCYSSLLPDNRTRSRIMTQQRKEETRSINFEKLLPMFCVSSRRDYLHNKVPCFRSYTLRWMIKRKRIIRGATCLRTCAVFRHEARENWAKRKIEIVFSKITSFFLYSVEKNFLHVTGFWNLLRTQFRSLVRECQIYFLLSLSDSFFKNSRGSIFEL